MRRARLKSVEPGACYHCVTRTVNGEALFGAAEKETLRKALWRAAAFSGLEVITYCLMSNHFHVLVRVPPGAASPDDAELARRYRALYPSRAAEMERTLAAGGDAAEALRARLSARMGDVSEFMKTLKQRFSIWFNKVRGRFGTLWAERFKSVLVEGEGHALRTVAAYIDLNPVRAGMAEDPKDYRFCGYAEAAAGSRRARAGLARVCGGPAPLADYRAALFGQGASPREGAGAIPPERARDVLRRGGRLSASAALRCRARYFTDGAALGSAAFVREAAARAKDAEQRKREAVPRPMEGADWGGLAVLRGLRGEVFG